MFSFRQQLFLISFLITNFCSLGQDVPSQKQTDSILIKKIENLFETSSNYYYEGAYGNSSKTNIEAIEVAKQLNDPKYLFKAYRFFAYDLMAVYDTIGSKEYFDKAKTYADITGNDTLIANTFSDLANYYSMFTTDYEKTVYYHKKSLEKLKGLKDSVALAKEYINTMMSARDAKKYGDLGPYLDEISIFKQREFYDEMDIATLYGMEGNYYHYKKEYGKAISAYEKLIKLSKEKGFPLGVAEGMKSMSVSLYEMGKYKEAYDIFESGAELNQMNFFNLQSESVQTAAAKFMVDEYKQKNQEILLKNKLQREKTLSQKRINYILLAFALISSLLLGITYVAYRKRRQLAASLKTKNELYLEAKSRSEKLMKAKSDFLSIVSHEIRTPLYGVIGTSTLLLEDESLKTHKKDLESLKFSADYLLTLINDVLQLNKLDTKDTDIKEENISFDLRALISNIVASFKHINTQNNNTFTIEISKDIPQYIHGNSIRLSQILMNLVSNACKYTKNGEVDIKALVKTADKKSVQVYFIVSDTGAGISKERQDYIFDEFTQIERLNYNQQSSGLGLPIVKKLLKLLNSDIHLESDPDKGSAFSFYLTFDISDKTPAQKKKMPTNTEALKGLKILVVEDNNVNKRVTQKILEKKGVICMTAENGEEAVTMAKKHSYDLILMDLNMPVKDGYQASKEIRSCNNEVPIIALTAVEEKNVNKKIVKAGINDIITKPYSMDQFIVTILENISKK